MKSDAPPCDPRRAICIDLLAEEYIDQPGKLGHVCRCRAGYSGEPGLDGSGCAPSVLELDGSGLRMAVGRGLDVKASFARAGDEPEIVSFSQLRRDIEELDGSTGAVTSVAERVESLAEGPVASNTEDLNAISASLDAGGQQLSDMSTLLESADTSAQQRSGETAGDAATNAGLQTALTGDLDNLEMDLLGLATDVGDLGDDLGDLATHVKNEIEDEVRVPWPGPWGRSGAAWPWSCLALVLNVFFALPFFVP